MHQRVPEKEVGQSFGSTSALLNLLGVGCCSSGLVYDTETQLGAAPISHTL